MSPGVSRRTFIVGGAAGATAVALGLSHLRGSNPPQGLPAPERVPEVCEERFELMQFVGGRRFVNAVQHWELFVRGSLGNQFVGHQHEVLDESVCLQSLHPTNLSRDAIDTQDHLGLREIEVDAPACAPAP